MNTDIRITIRNTPHPGTMSDRVAGNGDAYFEWEAASAGVEEIGHAISRFSSVFKGGSREMMYILAHAVLETSKNLHHQESGSLSPLVDGARRVLNETPLMTH